MKKLFYIGIACFLMVMCFIVTSCNPTTVNPPATPATPVVTGTPATTSELAKIDNIIHGIQTYYAPLQALAAAGINVLLPGTGGLITSGVALALSAADEALQNLGQMKTTGLTNSDKIALAQVALNTISAFVNTPATQKALEHPVVKAKLLELRK